jgi:hypothetical protein
VRCEGPILEDRIGEQIRGGHGHGHARGVESFAEVADEAIALGGGGIDRHQVVVVKVHSPGADLGEAMHSNDRIQWRSNELAEWIASSIADRPETKREFVRCGGSQSHVCGLSTEIDV